MWQMWKLRPGSASSGGVRSHAPCALDQRRQVWLPGYTLQLTFLEQAALSLPDSSSAAINCTARDLLVPAALSTVWARCYHVGQEG